MIKFLFKKDLWILDLLASISFSLVFGYKLLKNSLTGEPKWADISYGTAAYIFTFILAVSLQRKITWLRSWSWLGIIGALFRIIFLQILYLPKQLDHFRQFSTNFSETIMKITSDILIVTIFNWIFWAVFGLVFIFSARFLMYVFFNFLHLQRNNLQRSIK